MFALVFFPYLQLLVFAHCWSWARWTFNLTYRHSYDADSMIPHRDCCIQEVLY